MMRRPCWMTLVLVCVAAVLSLAARGRADGDDAADVLRRSAAAITAARTFTYTATREPGGVLAGQLASVSAGVRVARIAGEDSLGAKVWASGEVRVPRGAAAIAFVNAYDGTLYRSLRAADRTLVEGTPEAGGRGLFSDGGDGVLLEPLIDRMPFARELTSELSLKGESVVGGEPCVVVEVKMPASSSYGRARWHISREDSLPRRVEMIYALGGDKEGVQTTSAMGLEPGAALAADRFEVPLPEGYTRKTLEQASTLLAVGDIAPPWSLRDPAGALHTLADLKGRVVVLDFWATWCGPCRAAMPAVQRVHERFKGRGVAVFGVDYMDKGDAAGYVRDKGFTYTLLLDADAVGAQYGVVAIPVFYVIGTDGKIAYRHMGGGANTEAELDAAVQTALAAGGK